MSKSVKAVHTETYVFDNTSAGRKAAKQMSKSLKEKYGDEISMSTSGYLGTIVVTSRGQVEVTYVE